jgi:sodium transport system permease protein
MIILPMVLMPALIIGIGKFTIWQAQQMEEESVVIAMENREVAPELAERIEQNDKFELEEPADPRQAVADGELAAYIVFPPDFQEKVSRQEPVPVTLVLNSAETKSQAAVGRLESILSEYNQELTVRRLTEAGMGQSVLVGAAFQRQDEASQAEVGGMLLGFIVPLFIVMWSIVGGQYTAIDVSAGEKERKTLEPLLLTPAKRLHIILGKFLAVATAAAVSVLVSLGSFVAAFAYFGNDMFAQAGGAGELGISFSIEPAALLVMVTVGLLLVFLFSSALLSIAIFARSFKEAQSYIGPAYLVVILPIALLNSIPGFEPPLALFAVPAINAILLFKELLVGDYAASHLLLTYVSLAFFAGLALWLAARIYKQEKVLFK